jgi:cytochrome c peroxidase
LTTRWTIRLLVFIACGAVMINACRKSGNDRKGTTPLSLTIPAGFPQPAYTFATNPLTEEGFQLGRRLFYDGRLSKDGNFPCASCHQQFAAFANFDHDLSHGFNNQFTTRNSPGLFNMAWHKEMHWDGGINHIEVQPLAPITAPNEMAETVATVVKKLEADSLYPSMFDAAFGDRQITSQRMLFALTQFVGSIVSYNSKYDKMKRGEAVFNDAEKNGYAIFQARCASCHAEPLFTDLSFRNTGIPLKTGLDDIGRMRITNKKEDSLKFKVPSLRNVYLTFPYGHDGRFPSVLSMLNHYSDGVQPGPNVDPLVANRIPLSNVDKFYLTQFLITLTDSVLISDKRFSQPD